MQATDWTKFLPKSCVLPRINGSFVTESVVAKLSLCAFFRENDEIIYSRNGYAKEPKTIVSFIHDVEIENDEGDWDDLIVRFCLCVSNTQYGKNRTIDVLQFLFLIGS